MNDVEMHGDTSIFVACRGTDVTPAGYLVERKYPLLGCNNCGLSFLDIPDDDVNEEGFDDYWNDVNEHIYTHSSTISELTTKYNYYFSQLGAPVNKTLLDVGSGAGICVQVAQSLGFAAKGIEPSRRGAELSQKNYPIDVVCGLLSDGDDLPRDVGVVTLWDVIEHVADPQSLLESCCSHLVEGGYLVLETPDEGAFIRRIIRAVSVVEVAGDIKKNMHYRAHRQYFTTAAMEYLLLRSGFSEIRFYKQRTMYGKALLKSSLYGKITPLKRVGLKTVYWLLNRLPLLHNKMVVVAKK